MKMATPSYSMSTAAQFVGLELGLSDWGVVDQDQINRFADCTGDHQWIHVDPERAMLVAKRGGSVVQMERQT
jgi:acyl dehydratase